MELWQKVFVKTSIGWQKGLFIRNRGNDLEIMVTIKHGLPYEAVVYKKERLASVVASPSNVRIFNNQSHVDGATWLTQ